MNQSLKTQLSIINANLEKYLKDFQDEGKRKQVLEYAAKPLVDAAQTSAPVGINVHYRYKGNGKGKKRSGKGHGTIVATYKPGNLKGSIQVLKKLRKSKNVFVGPAVNKGKVFGPTKSDGYYAHMVEYGTSQKSARPFFRPALERSRGQVLRRIEIAVKVLHDRYKPIT